MNQKIVFYLERQKFLRDLLESYLTQKNVQVYGTEIAEEAFYQLAPAKVMIFILSRELLEVPASFTQEVLNKYPDSKCRFIFLLEEPSSPLVEGAENLFRPFSLEKIWAMI